MLKHPLFDDLACLWDFKTGELGLKGVKNMKKYALLDRIYSLHKRLSKVAFLQNYFVIDLMYCWQLESADSDVNSPICWPPKLTLPKRFFTFSFFSFLTLDLNNFFSICSNEVWFFLLNRGWKWQQEQCLSFLKSYSPPTLHAAEKSRRK